jgi:DNA-binding SARP family transcriptional activator/tetratricopeptide (TPR) repeat protein
MARLELGLLGPFQVRLDSHPVEGLTSDRLRALLAYLAVERRREHPREALAALLWPERPDQEALSALRYALSNLRGILGDRNSSNPFLLVTRNTVQFNTASVHWLDVSEFESLAVRPDAPELERAVALYRGPLLEGLSVGDSPAFEQWLLLQAEETRRLVLSLHGRLISLQMAHGAYTEAARWARQQLELEPYREQAHRQLMVALALGGERSAALAHYAACRRLLAEELGCEPEDETQALYAQIRSGVLPSPGPPAHAAEAPAPVPAGVQPPAHFVAREPQLARLEALLEEALGGQGGVAFIVGEAGAGKSALLDEFARQATEARGDLITLRGQCNAHGGAGDLYLPFREILQMLAGDVEGKRAGGTLSMEQARRAWEALPTVVAALVEHGHALIDRFVPGEALLRRVGGVPPTSSARRWQARLEEIVSQPGSSLSTPEPPPNLFAEVTEVLRIVSLRNPLLLSVDDLQWADGGTAALLFHLGRRLAGCRILLVCAYRPEALDSRSGLRSGRREGDEAIDSGVGTIVHELCRLRGDVLVDLDKADGRAFVEAFVDSEPNRLGAAFRQGLYDHTGGNPLFTVELLRGFEHAGSLIQDEDGRWVETSDLDWDRWPQQVEAVIAGHLAALTDEDRTLLQAASVQGEQFAAEVAARVMDWDEAAAVQRLSGALGTQHRLIQAVSLDRLPSSGQHLSHYRFRHGLVQRTAYHSLDVVQRARLHEATARALDAVYGLEGELPASLAPTLARHFEAAGMPFEAAGYHLEAGRWAANLVDYDAAIAHLNRGLALLEGVPPTTDRLRLELGLCAALVTPALLQRGWQAPARMWALERLSDLVQHPDLLDDPQRLTALSVLALLAGWSADPGRSQRVGEQLLDLAQEGDRQTRLLGHWALGLSYWLQGRNCLAREHLDHTLALYDLEANHPLSGFLVGDLGVMARAFLGAVLWQLGYPDQGRAGLRQAVARAQALDQPSSLAFAHYVATMVTSVIGRDVAAAVSHARSLRPLSQGSLVYRNWAEIVEGLSQTQSEHAGDCIAESNLQEGLARMVSAGSTWQATGGGTGFASLMLLQASMCAGLGRVETGLGAIDQAQAWIEHSGIRATEAEVWRVRGELMLIDQPGKPAQVEEAEVCFERALALAREQGSRWWELGAALNLARLWQAQSRREQARELLAGICGWFTEGFDTVDLVEAKNLLQELGLFEWEPD